MKKRVLNIASIILMAVLMLSSVGTSVFAGIDYEENGVETLYYDLKSNADSRTESNFLNGAETISIELIDPATLEKLDPSIATASFTNNKYGTNLKFTFKKEGKVYVAHKYIKKGEQCGVYWAYEVVDTPYTCPVKSLKLGKINMTKKLGHSCNLTGKAFKGKVTFKTKSGWKLTKISKYNGTTCEKTGKSPKITTLKKGQTVTLKKGWNYSMTFKKGDKTAYICYKAR